MQTSIKDLKASAELLKILSHPVRLCIVQSLLEKEGCNVSFIQNCMGLPQSTVSTHLQKLRAAGIVDSQRKGLEVTYTVVNEKVRTIIPFLLS